MVAAFDYNPRESSPNMDVEVRTHRGSPAREVVAAPAQGSHLLLGSPQAELPFRAGDIITVFGDMDDDGFYYVRTLGYAPHPPFQGGLPRAREGDELGFLKEARRNGLSHW